MSTSCFTMGQGPQVWFTMTCKEKLKILEKVACCYRLWAYTSSLIKMQETTWILPTSPAQICVKTLSQVLAFRGGYTELYKGRIQTSLKGGWVLVYLQSDSTHQTWIQWVFSFRSHLRCRVVFNLPSMHVKLAHLPNCISVQAPWKSAWNQPLLSHPITNTINPKFLYKGKSNFRSSKCRLGREDWGSCLPFPVYQFVTFKDKKSSTDVLTLEMTSLIGLSLHQ